MNRFETDTLLFPVIGESPVGENIEYDPVYSEIREARQNDPDYMSQGEWAVSDPRRADWRKVKNYVRLFYAIRVKIYRSVVGMWSR